MVYALRGPTFLQSGVYKELCCINVALCYKKVGVKGFKIQDQGCKLLLLLLFYLFFAERM